MAEPMLRIATGTRMPLTAATETFAILAKRGRGKSYASAVMAEELLGAGVPVVIIDPTGVHWGLRSSADGRRPGLPVVIVGGDHADVPLEESAGELLAELVAARQVPMVLDLSGLRKNAMRRLVTDFLETLYRKNRAPLHLIVDECDLFAPQRAFAGVERLLGSMEDVVRRGRVRGLGVTLISQRPAAVSKSVLTQVETLILLGMTGRQDITAVDEWIRVHADEEQARAVKASLPSLPVGTAWLWSPHWLGVLERIEVRARRTFDSSSTPTAGRRVAEPTRWATVDLDALGEQIAATVQQAKDADPRHLRARIVELERVVADLRAQLDSAQARPAEVETVTVEWPVFQPQLADQLGQVAAQLGDQVEQMQAAVAAAQTLVARSERQQPTAAVRPVSVPSVQSVRPPARDAMAGSSTRPRTAHTEPDTDGGPLPRAARLALTAIVQRHPAASTKQQVALVAGYAITGGGFNNALGRLRSLGLIDGSKDALVATPAGLAALGDVDPLPTGQALLEHWYGQLPKAAGLVLQALAKAWPHALSRDEVAASTNYEPTGGGFNNALGRLRTLELIEGDRSALRARDVLFGA